MVLRTHSTGTVTMTGAATPSSTLSNITGKIIALVIKPSGTSTDFRISTTKAGVTEYLFGSAGAVSVAAAGEIIYPVVLRQDLDGTALTDTANQYGHFVLDNGDITIAVANGAASETYVVEVIVEE